MTKPTVNFTRNHPSAQLPIYSTVEAAGADVRSVRAMIINPGARALVPTGLGCSIPKGWEIQVRPRSGLAYKSGIMVVNSPGTIDSDYTGEIAVLLINLGNEPFVIEVGDRIAQLVVAPSHQAEFLWAAEARDTDRGADGFGSTGVK